MQLYRTYLKRLFDFFIALLLLIITLPVTIPVTIILLIVNGGKPFFLQRRPGIHAQIFTIVKFKTMTDKKDKQGKLLPDEERITAIGKFIRQTSIDELLQLVNVVKGDMSIIGPRPLLVQYLPLYTAFQQRRHEVKPGITGWSQVNGRNAISWEEKFTYDVWYVDNISLKLDLKILWLTIQNVLKQKDISQQGHATMPYFTGSSEA